MLINYKLIFKIFFFLIFIILSVNFFYLGYSSIEKIKINKTSGTTIEKKKNEPTKNALSIDQDNINYNTDSSKSLSQNEIETINNIEEEIIITVKKNDNFSKLIDPYVTNNQIKYQIIELINEEFDLRKLSIGQKIFLYFPNDFNKKEITKIIIPINFNTNLIIKKNTDNTFTSNKKILPIKLELAAKKFTISNSLFEDGINADLPLTILSDIIKLYSFDIDFQRDIRKGNQLEVLYEVFFNENRKTLSYGELIYINLSLQKNNLEYFLFKSEEGFSDYYNIEGKNVKKALMKTPLDGAKLSSSFGMRKHPILGYNKMHRGVDFAASKGTSVYAAGNGVIEYVGNNGGYGKYIRIRHNSSYKTAYAHLSGFKKNISKGVRVSQGQIIGYVGSTGKSTGPHLHYEVIYNNQQINPMKMKLPSGKVLKGKNLEKFKKSIKKTYANFLFNLYE